MSGTAQLYCTAPLPAQVTLRQLSFQADMLDAAAAATEALIEQALAPIRNAAGVITLEEILQANVGRQSGHFVHPRSGAPLSPEHLHAALVGEDGMNHAYRAEPCLPCLNSVSVCRPTVPRLPRRGPQPVQPPHCWRRLPWRGRHRDGRASVARRSRLRGHAASRATALRGPPCVEPPPRSALAARIPGTVHRQSCSRWWLHPPHIPDRERHRGLPWRVLRVGACEGRGTAPAERRPAAPSYMYSHAEPG
jgi:hypothetical protein